MVTETGTDLLGELIRREGGVRVLVEPVSHQRLIWYILV